MFVCFGGRTPQYPYHHQYHHHGLTPFWKGPLTAHLLEMGQDAEQDPLVGRSPRGIFRYCEVFLYLCVLSSTCETELFRLELKSILLKKKKRKEEEEEMTLYLTHSYKLNPNNTSQPMR